MADDELYEIYPGKAVRGPSGMDKRLVQKLYEEQMASEKKPLPSMPRMLSPEEKRDKLYRELEETGRKIDPTFTMGKGEDVQEFGAWKAGEGLVSQEGIFKRALLNRSVKAASFAKRMTDWGMNVEVIPHQDKPYVLWQNPDTGLYHEIDLKEDDGSKMADIADFFGRYGNVQTAAALMSVFATKGVASMPLRMLLSGLSESAGHVGDAAIEELSGYGERSLGEVAQGAGVAGAMGAGGEGVGSVVARGANVLRGQAPFPFLPQRARQVRANALIAKELELPYGTLANMPGVLRAIARQAIASSDVGVIKYSNQLSDMYKGFSRMRDELGNFRDLDDRALQRIGDEYTGKLKAALKAPFDPKESLAVTEETLLGATRYYKYRTEVARRRYSKVEEAARPSDVIWDISDTQRIAEDMRNGVYALGKEEGAYVRWDNLPADFKRILDDLTEAQSSVKTHEMPLPEATVKTLPGGEQAHIGPAKEMNSFRQVRTIRTRLWNVKNNLDGQTPTEVQHMAGELWDSLTDVMDNPVTDNPKLKGLVKKAASYHRETEQMFNDHAGRIFLSQKDRPVELLELITGPGDHDALRQVHGLLKRTPGGRERWEYLRGGFRNQLLENPHLVHTRLDSFKSEAVRNLLVSSDEATLLKQYADDMAEWSGGQIGKLSQEGRRMGSRAMDLVRAKDYPGLQVFLRETEHTPELRHALKAGFIEAALEKSRIDLPRGGPSGIDPKKFMKEMHNLNGGNPLAKEISYDAKGRPVIELDEDNILPSLKLIFTKDELVNLAKADAVLQPWADVTMGTGVGSSLAVAEAGAGFLTRKAVGSYMWVGKRALAARLLLDPEVAKRTLGMAEPGGDGLKTSLRAAAHASASLLNQARDTSVRFWGQGARPIGVEEDRIMQMFTPAGAPLPGQP